MLLFTSNHDVLFIAKTYYKGSNSGPLRMRSKVKVCASCLPEQ